MLEKDKHQQFIIQCLSKRTRLYYLSEPMRLSTLYWMLNSLALMEKVDLIESMAPKVVALLKRCQNEDGGFGANVKYASSPLSTLSALQIMSILQKNRISYSRTHQVEAEVPPEAAELKRAGEFTIKDRLDELLFMSSEADANEGMLDEEAGGQPAPDQINYVMCNAYLEGIVQNGKLVGYAFNELDQRFVCCYVASKHLLAQLCPGSHLEVFYILPQIKALLCEYIAKCTNFDGGVGPEPGCESHAAHTFCAVASLFLMGEVGVLDINRCARFLALRQQPSGGIAGRVDKEEDGCYSFWSYSALLMLGKETYVDQEALKKYVLRNQSPTGGFSDKPGGVPDLFHTMFSLAALGLLGNAGVVQVVPSLALCLND